jgi:hypothetical protein
VTLALYVVAVLAVLFIVSGVLPQLRRIRTRLRRAEEFERRYRAWLDARERDNEGPTLHYGPAPEGSEASELHAWLAARRNEMQRDAQSVGKGVMYVAPPLMVGGGPYQRHAYFTDLFDEQTFTDHAPSFRLDELATVRHELARTEAAWRRAVINPWAWMRLSFERLIGFPSYVLRRAGFSEKVTNSTGARIVTVAWSLVVGFATIGAFVVGLIQLAR